MRRHRLDRGPETVPLRTPGRYSGARRRDTRTVAKRAGMDGGAVTRGQGQVDVSAPDGQRIARLTPWSAALAAIDALARPVTVREVAVGDALACVLAQDVLASVTLPAVPVAVRDGWAVEAAAIADAGPYAPVLLAAMPVRVDAGDALPPPCDAVLALDALTITGALVEVIAPVSPGEGVLPAGADLVSGDVLLREGHRLRALDVAVLAAAGMAAVPVRRPRIGVAILRRAGAGEIDAVSLWLLPALAAAGAEAVAVAAVTAEAAFAAATDGLDALITVGGTGVGPGDRTITALARAGEVVAHGLAIRPGETAAIGRVDGRPVLLLPGRPDAALAAWLTAGRVLASGLTGASVPDNALQRPLTRKITSTIGLAEVVLVESDAEAVRPVAAGLFPLRTLAQACGFVLVPPESEGYPMGAIVAVRPLP